MSERNNKRCRSDSQDESKDDSPQSDTNDFEFDNEPEMKKKRRNTTKNINLLERLFPEQKAQVKLWVKTT